MNSDASRRAEFDRLVAALCDERLSLCEVLHLEALVLSDGGLRDRYLKHMQVHAIVARRGQHSLEVASDAEMDPGVELDRPNTLRGFVPHWLQSSTIFNRYSSAAAVLLAALIFYGSFTLLAWNLRPAANMATAYHNRHEQILETTQPVRSKATGDRPIVARVLAVQNDRWRLAPGEKNPPLIVGSQLETAHILELVAGLVEVQLADGARVVLEGPAIFSFQTSNTMRLDHGNLVARVPHTAIGFAVQTPQAQIVDLGTEFGVEADATGQTSVEVFQGKVEVNYITAAGATGTPPNVVQMTAGQAKQFSKRSGKEGIAVTDVVAGMRNRRPKAFAASLRNADKEAASQNYAVTVLADRPLVYWRLNDGETGIAADASGHGNNASYQGAMRTNQGGMWLGSKDRSAQFFGSDAPGWLEMKDIEIPASFSVELWARSTGPEWNTWGWLISSRMPNGFAFQPEKLGSRLWRFVVFSENEDHCMVGWHEPEKIDDRFHHYVGSYDAEADHGRMYFDGTLVAEVQSLVGEKRIREPRKLTVLVGRDNPKQGPICGKGWVDEVALYPHVLSAEAVERHFNAADGMTPLRK